MRTRRRIATPKSCHTDHEVHANDDHDDPDNHDDHEGGEQEEEPLPRQVAILIMKFMLMMIMMILIIMMITKVENKKKNRYPDKLPYDHNRVLLNALSNGTNSDYINASTVVSKMIMMNDDDE